MLFLLKKTNKKSLKNCVEIKKKLSLHSISGSGDGRQRKDIKWLIGVVLQKFINKEETR